MGPLFRSSGLPSHHAGMLLVRMKPQPAAADFDAAMAAARGPLGGGLQALAFYERAGMVTRVTPVSRAGPHVVGRTLAVPSAAGRFAATPIAAADAGGEGLSAPALNLGAILAGDARAGRTTNLVELAAGADLRALQLALAADRAWRRSRRCRCAISRRARRRVRRSA